MKSKLAKARDEWLLSDEGKRCCFGTATGQYLQNRLELAFLAGANFSIKRIEELEGIMVIIQKESSDGLSTMKNEERPDIQRLLRRTFSLVSGCQIMSKP